MPPDLKVCIVEDERPFRDWLAQLLASIDGMSCSARHANAETALRSVPQAVPDLLLVDLQLPRLSGISCIRQLKELCPSLKIVAVTKFEDADLIFQALEAGADGYLLKSAPPSELARGIREAALGGAPLSSEVAARVVAFFHKRGKRDAEITRLSPREHQILEMLSQGYSYKEIGERLEIATQTVNGYTKSIYDKLHVHSRGQAVAKYRRDPA